VYHLQWFQVITANLIGDVTGTAGHALINDILHPVGIGALAVDEREGNGKTTAGGVTEEVIISYTRAALGKSPALDVVKRNPLAIGALAASLHISFIFFKRHSSCLLSLVIFS
jgi:hypothetical protein